jgi:hypothetical protein
VTQLAATRSPGARAPRFRGLRRLRGLHGFRGRAWRLVRVPARFCAWLLIWAFLCGSATPARADDDTEVAAIKLGFTEHRGTLVVDELGLGSLLFDPPAYRKLKESPLPTIIAVRLYVYRQGEEEPIAYRFMTARIVYDLWLEQYEVRVDSPKGRDSGHFSRLDQAYKMMTQIANLPITELGAIAIGPHYYLGVIAELNPVSSETLAEMRRWLSRPAAATSLDRGTSFFGSFVSIFVNAKVPEADRVARARSQLFYRVRR